MVRGTLIAESAVATEDLTLRKERAVIQISVLERSKRAAARKASVERAAMWFVIGVVTTVVSIYATINTLSTRFPMAYAWYNSPSGRLDPQYPMPQGGAQVTVKTAAVTASFPLLATMGTLTFRMPKIPPQGALFLLQMVGSYGESRNLKGVHVNGSATQLRFANLEDFLPTGNASEIKSMPNWGYIWEAWSAVSSSSGSSANPWFNTLWLTFTEFQLSPAIQNYYGIDTGGAISRPPDRTLIQSLFKGGLAYIAQNNFQNNMTADQMVKNLMAERYVQESAPCDAVQKVHAAFSEGTQWAGYGMIAMSVGPALLNLIPGFEEMEVAYKVGLAVASVGGLAAAGAAKGAGKKSCGVTTAVTAKAA